MTLNPWEKASLSNGTDTSSFVDPSGVEGSVGMTISWEDLDSTSVRIYVCNSSFIEVSGCWDREMVRKVTTDNPIQVSFTPEESDLTNSSYWIMVCDESNRCSNNYMGDYYVNHRPAAMNVTIMPLEPDKRHTLSCNYIFDPDDTGINDSIDATDSYVWYDMDDQTILGITKELTSGFSRDDSIMCSVKARDNQGLVDSLYRNSTPILIRNSPPEFSVNLYSYPQDSDDIYCNVTAVNALIDKLFTNH